ncbi:VirB8/TrbF family protein [Candidatus Xenohaliotis californiensis]
MLKKNTYFSNALKWYEVKYLSCFVEKVFVVIILVISVLLLTTLAIYIKFYYKSKIPLPIIRNIEHTTDGSLNIKQLLKNNHDDTPQIATAKYMIQQYVLFREAYGMYSKKEQLNYIKDNSSYQIYRDFLAHINNIEHQKSKKKTSKKAYFYPIIDNISIIQNEKQTKASVDCTIYVIMANKIIEKKMTKISLDFSLSDISLVNKKIIPLSFLVNSYNSGNNND